ncbi:MAG: ABC transporter permease [Chloroflexota bacterium]
MGVETAAPPPVTAQPRGADAEERMSVATQWQLMWWRFRKHRLAMLGGLVVLVFYLVVIFADFLAYADPDASDANRQYMPPQTINWTIDGKFAPNVFYLRGERDLKTLKRVYTEDRKIRIPLEFFARGYKYRLLGLFETDIHLLGVGAPILEPGASLAPVASSGAALAAQLGLKLPATTATAAPAAAAPVKITPENSLFLVGTDQQGRDMWSRTLIATRVSLTIGLFGVALSLVLGVVFGSISGFYGGTVDTVIQRVIEVLRSVPTIPLWMGLAASIPREWSVEQVYFMITLIISLIGWTELARVVRGRFLALREEDFVTAADLIGCSRARIIFVHMVPLILSHIIAATSLALPSMIVSETSLSFLGLGMRPPAISWGVLLQQAQNVQSVALSPWLLYPAVPVVVVILAFNFLGDGLRDAADPYGV